MLYFIRVGGVWMTTTCIVLHANYYDVVWEVCVCRILFGLVLEKANFSGLGWMREPFG